MGASGLIPAHAGKTAAPTRKSPPKRAHPRSRGENRFVSMPWFRSLGSSPLTRGKLAGPEGILLEAGLIPTRAGKTPRCTSPPQTCAAHPRSRGKNSSMRSLRMPSGAHPRSRRENPK